MSGHAERAALNGTLTTRIVREFMAKTPGFKTKAEERGKAAQEFAIDAAKKAVIIQQQSEVIDEIKSALLLATPKLKAAVGVLSGSTSRIHIPELGGLEGVALQDAMVKTILAQTILLTASLEQLAEWGSALSVLDNYHVDKHTSTILDGDGKAFEGKMTLEELINLQTSDDMLKSILGVGELAEEPFPRPHRAREATAKYKAVNHAEIVGNEEDDGVPEDASEPLALVVSSTSGSSKGGRRGFD